MQLTSTNSSIGLIYALKKILNKEYIEMKKINQNELILEIKYPINLHDEVKMCMNFPISRLQKNSKYVRCFFG